MESPQPELEPQLWNELPPEILGLILSNLGKHDLLNARMVSHAWNDESLNVLRKSNFTQLLRERTIEEYILFITSSERHPFIIPFHLNFEIDLGVLGLFNALTSNVESLCQIFGPQCVSALTLATNGMAYTEENIRETGLMEFLTLISPGLKTLDMTRIYFKIDFLPNQIITFPILEKLSCNTSHFDPGRSGPEVAFISIIENSPKLEDLTLTHPCDLEPWPLNFNKLKSLSFDITMSNPQIVLDKILAISGPPLLRELSFADDLYLPDQNVVYNILESVSSTLKSLQIRESLYSVSDGFPRFTGFPLLPHLEHLGLEYNVVESECWINAEDLNLNAETFPSLKSIELPIGFMFTPTMVQSPEDTNPRIGMLYKPIEFPNLIQLLLRVGNPETDEPHLWNGKLGRLQRTFSAPSKLSLVNVGGDACVKHLLARIMKSDWSKNIQEIEIIGFRQDYLGQFLGELEMNPRIVLENCNANLEGSVKMEFRKNMERMGMECEEIVVAPGHTILTRRANESDSIKMTNITTIKLEKIIGPFDRDRDYFHCWSVIASTPNLLSIGKHFPQLCMIEISELLFHQMDKNIRNGQILEFKSKFPGVNLYLT